MRLLNGHTSLVARRITSVFLHEDSVSADQSPSGDVIVGGGRDTRSNDPVC